MYHSSGGLPKPTRVCGSETTPAIIYYVTSSRGLSDFIDFNKKKKKTFTAINFVAIVSAVRQTTDIHQLASTNVWRLHPFFTVEFDKLFRVVIY